MWIIRESAPCVRGGGGFRTTKPQTELGRSWHALYSNVVNKNKSKYLRFLSLRFLASFKSIGLKVHIS